MEDLYVNASSQNQTYVVDEHLYNNTVIYVVTCAIVSVSLPLNLVAIYAVYSLVQKDNVAPIYVINLLISDLIQLCCMIIRMTKRNDQNVFLFFFKLYIFGLMVSVGFMVCIALERYLVLVWPLWYRFKRTIKMSLMVCVVVWALPLVIIIADFFWGRQMDSEIIFAVFVLLPYPLLIFFLVGTLKALSAAKRVPADEKRRIVALLVLVLLIYTLLFLPTVIWCLEATVRNNNLIYLAFVVIKFSPLADLCMYVFLRKGTVDKVLASLCCRKMGPTDISSTTV